MRSGALSRVLHTVLAVSSVGLALLLAWSFPGLGTQSPALLLVAAVMVSAWVGGWGPGVLAAALSTVVLHYFLLPPTYTFAWGEADLVQLPTFAAVAGLTAWLNGQCYRAEGQTSTKFPLHWWRINSTLSAYIGSTSPKSRIAAGESPRYVRGNVFKSNWLHSPGKVS